MSAPNAGRPEAETSGRTTNSGETVQLQLIAPSRRAPAEVVLLRRVDLGALFGSVGLSGDEAGNYPCPLPHHRHTVTLQRHYAGYWRWVSVCGVAGGDAIDLLRTRGVTQLGTFRILDRLTTEQQGGGS